MANKEIYRLSIDVKVDGTDEAKTKLSAMERMTQQTEKKMKALNKVLVSPTAKIRDNASSTISKINSKATALNNARINPTAKITDNASNRIDYIFSKLKRLDATQTNATIRVKDEASSAAEKIQKKTEKLKDSVPTVRLKAEDNASSTITKLENKINGWIKAGAKKVISLGLTATVAMGGIGIGSAVNTFAKFEQGLSNVKAVTDATDAQMKQLSDTAKSLGASTAWSASAVTDAEQLLGQAGYSVNETIAALPGLLSLASAGSLDLSTATSIASSTLRAFNLSAGETTHVADVLASTANATNSDVTDLGESLKYISPVAQSLGISMEDAVAATGLLSNQAIVGSQAGTVLRQTMARLASPTDEAAKMMKKYGINAFDAKGNMKPLSGVVDNLNSSLGKLTSQQRADVISTIFGTESMSGVLSLMNQGGQSLSDLSQKLKDTKGSADKMAETKLDNLLGQWEQLKGAAETMQINLGERLAPYAKQFVTWLTNKMPEIENKVVSIVDYLSKHTDDIKTLAMTVIGLGTAFTALSTAGKIGNTISGISSFVNLFKGVSVTAETATIVGGLLKIGALGRLLPLIFNPAGLAVAASVALIGTAVVANNNLMEKSITTTTEELGPMEKVMNKLHGNLNKSKKEMVALNLIYDDFGEGISDKFKKAAQDASKSLLKLDMNINRFTNDNKFDDAENNQLKNWVNDMAYEGINAIKEKQSKIKDELSKTFSLDGVTSKSEQGTLDYMDKFFGEGVNKELQIRDEMYKIGDTAIKEHGKLLDEDIQKLKEKAAELQQIKLEYANAESAGESAYARSKFTSAAERVTGVDGASELLQERAKEHQSSIDETKANYDKTIATTQYHLDNDKNLSLEDRSALETQLKETTAARDEALKQAEKDWKSDLETLYKSYPRARGMLNEDTGAKFNDGEKVMQTTQQKIDDSHPGLSAITQSGVYTLQNEATKNLDTLYVSIDEKTGKIKGLLNGSTGEIGAYSDQQKEKLLALQEEYSATGAAMQQLIDKQVRVGPDSNNIVNGIGSVVGTLSNVQTAADKTKTGILDLNGTPFQITADADGAILSIRKVDDGLDGIDNRIVRATIETRYVNFTNEADAWRKLREGYATGTSNATTGLHPVAERGFEIVFNRQNRWFNGGEKVLNHEQSKAFLKKQQNNEPFQVKQGQYQVATPQIAVAGGGNTIQVEVQNNIDGNQDVEEIVAQAVNEFAYKLKDALVNIK